MRCTDIAAVKVNELTELIQKSLDDDAAARLSGTVGMVTSTDDVAAAAASVQLSHTVSVNMTDAKHTALTVLNDTVSDDDASSTSSLDSVPSAALIDSGIYQSSLLHLSIDYLASEVFIKFAVSYSLVWQILYHTLLLLLFVSIRIS